MCGKKKKRIKDMNVRHETTKPLEENIGSTLFDIILTNIFLDISPQARETKAKINEWDYNKLKTFCTARKPSTKQKHNLPNGRRYLQIIYSIRG